MEGEKMNIDDLIREAHGTALEKGWYDGVNGREAMLNAVRAYGRAMEALGAANDSLRAKAADEAFIPVVALVDKYVPTRLNTGERLMLIVTELAEAMEENRKGQDLKYDYKGPTGKPEGFSIELADAVIRIADLCGAEGIDLRTALEVKLAYNKTRSHRHGGKVA